MKRAQYWSIKFVKKKKKEKSNKNNNKYLFYLKNMFKLNFGIPESVTVHKRSNMNY